MRDAIDKTSTQQGTLINRDFLMGIQGFDNITTVFNADGSVTQTNGKGEEKVITFGNGKIIAKFTGKKTITKTITVTNNMIKEALS